MDSTKQTMEDMAEAAAKQREYYHRNREQIRAKFRDRYAKNTGGYRDYLKKWKREHPEVGSAQAFKRNHGGKEAAISRVKVNISQLRAKIVEIQEAEL